MNKPKWGVAPTPPRKPTKPQEVSEDRKRIAAARFRLRQDMTLRRLMRELRTEEQGLVFSLVAVRTQQRKLRKLARRNSIILE